MALILILLLLTFGIFGVGSGSTGGSPVPQRVKPHHVSCKARMGSGESRRDCGGPPANP